MSDTPGLVGLPLSEPRQTDQARGPLHGIRVLDLAGPSGLLCTKLLADAGADVIKVEPPGGDRARHRPPFQGDVSDPERSLYFLHFNANKRGVTLDLQIADGQMLFRRLVEQADVVVETFPPGHMEALGLGYEELRRVNPGLVQTSISHFGQTGPYRDYQGNDTVCFALGGLMGQSGEPDAPPLIAPGELAYSLASSFAAQGTAVALFHRAFSGQGQYVEVSVHEAAVNIAGYAVPVFSATGRKPFRQSWRTRLFDLHDVYPCSDGYVRMFVVPKRHWQALLDWIGRPPELTSALFDDEHMRWENSELVDPYVEQLCRKQTKDQLFAEGQKRHIPTTPVNTPGEFANDPHVGERDLFVSTEHPVVGPYRQMGPIHKYSETPGTVFRSAPTIGQHNAEVYSGELGVTTDELTDLKAAGAI